MQVAENTVVSFHYVLTNDAGERLDASPEGQPMPYLHGHNNLIPGLEKAMVGKGVGEEFDVTVPPAEAYGEHDPKLDLKVGKEQFGTYWDQIKPGVRFQNDPGDGQLRVFTVHAKDEDMAFVSANHPLAGQALTFAVKIDEVREATEDEIAQGGLQAAHACCGGSGGEECCGGGDDGGCCGGEEKAQEQATQATEGGCGPGCACG